MHDAVQSGDPTDVAETAQPSLRDTKKACATYATESNVADCSESSSMAAGRGLFWEE